MRLAVVFCILLPALTWGQIETNSSVRPTHALAMADNDFSTEENPKGQVETIPLPVAVEIEKLTQDLFKFRLDQSEEYDRSWITAAKFGGPIFRITAPNDTILYVFHQKDILGSSELYFYLYDPQTSAATKDPPHFYGKWMYGQWGGALEKPLAAFEDLDKDNRFELVVQERVHNGTMYNAVVYHYYQINEDLSLSHILARETRLHSLANDGEFVRSVSCIGSNRLALETRFVPYDANADTKNIGLIELSRSTPLAAYQIDSANVSTGTEMLVTGSGVDANDFLAKGYNIYY